VEQSTLTLQNATLSVAEFLALQPDSVQQEFFNSLSEAEAAKINYQWAGFWARPEQILPGTPGATITSKQWRFWLVQTGRGWGKTKTGAATVAEWAKRPGEVIHLVAPTSGDVRSVMIEGPSGLLSCFAPKDRPEYEPTRRRIAFASGAIAITFSADEPERLRGPQCSKFWADELASWRRGEEAWDNLIFGFRIGDDLRGVITTTPKPIKLLKQIQHDPGTVITRGSTKRNRGNLAPGFLETVIAKYEGTRLGRQELEGETLEDVPGALWTRQLIEDHRHESAIPLRRIVVAIDPAVTATEGSDETGIIVAGLAPMNAILHAFVLDDLSGRYTPREWASLAIKAYYHYSADRIIGEKNNGGDLVELNIRAFRDGAINGADVAYRGVTATRGKALRAEPVAALYEQGRVHHVGRDFAQLEDQLCSWIPGESKVSPDRMDALVWALTDLIVDPVAESTTVVYTPPWGISRY
jgi:phage terminase large subunit-like protein